MKTRRQVICFLGSLFWRIPAFFGIIGSMSRTAFAKVRKILLPKDTAMSDLISKNPSELDTRQLGITPMEEFEVMGQTTYPVDIKTWRLEFFGDVKKPKQFSYEQLLDMPAIERNVLLICPDFFAYNARWKGISMPEFLDLIELKKGVTHIKFGGPLGIREKTEKYAIEDVLAGKIFLAYEVNGVPLPERHGFPLRLVAEGHYGSQWEKYVHQISAVIAPPDRKEGIDTDFF